MPHTEESIWQVDITVAQPWLPTVCDPTTCIYW